MKRELRFPEGFLWGTAAAGHQVEGSNEHSDWWAWEQRGKIRDGTTSGISVDYWNRYDEDHALMAELGYGAHRLGVEWARVEPHPGNFDESALDHYEDILRSLRQHGLQVCLTLHHWVLPAWAAERGGWADRGTLPAFLRFARKVVRRLGGLTDLWVTLNEPMVPVMLGYLLGMFPPEKRNPWQAIRVARTLLTGHAATYRIVHALCPAGPDGRPPRVGTAMAYPWSEPWGSRAPLGLLETALAGAINQVSFDGWDRSIAEGRYALPWGLPFERPLVGLKMSCDFCGVNYYFRQSMKLDELQPEDGGLRVGPVPPGVETTDMGWQVHPESFYAVMRHVWRRFGKPIYITENGIADATDVQRPRYLLRHLAQVHRAIQNGVNVRGYFHWTFTDNFEWAEGFAKRFGLVAVDHTDPDLTRRPRPSAHMYGAIARSNAITEELVEEVAPELLPELFA